MTEAELRTIFEDLRKEVERVLSCHFKLKYVIDDPKKYPKARDYAMTDGYTVFLAPKILKANLSRVQGLLRHEMGHAVFLQAGWHDHTERQTDKMAEVLFGDVIYYDKEDIQTIEAKGNKTPRPSYLHK